MVVHSCAIHVPRAGVDPQPWSMVPALLDGWIADACALRGADAGELVEELATLHARFEQIHPFLDGNGRAERLLLNLMLVRLGYLPQSSTRPTGSAT